MNTQTVLFDIDGTLADIRHRRGFLDGDRPDWTRFNDAMGDDLPNYAVVALHRALWDSGKYEIILTTGRTEKFRSITETWLIWNEIPFGRIIMRANKDNRADYLVKEEMLNKLLDEGHQIIFAVDDRQQVVDMWRRNGITCLQCDVGDF